MSARWEKGPVVLDYNFDYHRSREESSAFQLSGVRRTPDPVCSPLVDLDGNGTPDWGRCPTPLLAPLPTPRDSYETGRLEGGPGGLVVELRPGPVLFREK